MVALAAQAQTGDAVIIDDYNRIDVDFLDASHPPAIYSPGARIDNPSRYARVVALKREDILSALGTEAASRAAMVERSPDGRAAVWSVKP